MRELLWQEEAWAVELPRLTPRVARAFRGGGRFRAMRRFTAAAFVLLLACLDARARARGGRYRSAPRMAKRRLPQLRGDAASARRVVWRRWVGRRGRRRRRRFGIDHRFDGRRRRRRVPRLGGHRRVARPGHHPRRSVEGDADLLGAQSVPLPRVPAERGVRLHRPDLRAAASEVHGCGQRHRQERTERDSNLGRVVHRARRGRGDRRHRAPDRRVEPRPGGARRGPAGAAVRGGPEVRGAHGRVLRRVQPGRQKGRPARRDRPDVPLGRRERGRDGVPADERKAARRRRRVFRRARGGASP